MVYIAWLVVSFILRFSKKLISFLHSCGVKGESENVNPRLFSLVSSNLFHDEPALSSLPHNLRRFKGAIKKNRIVLLDQIPQLPRRAVWCHEGLKLPRRVILLLEQQINFKFESPTSFGSVTNIIIVQAGCQT